MGPQVKFRFEIDSETVRAGVVRLVIVLLTSVVLIVADGIVVTAPAQNKPPHQENLLILGNDIAVTDPRAYSPIYLRRFFLLSTEYCAPQIETLKIFGSTVDAPARGASAWLDPDTLTNSNPPKSRPGVPNPEWNRRMHIDITSSSQDWGFRVFVKIMTGRDLADIAESDLSTIDQVREIIGQRTEEQRRNVVYQRQFFLRLGSSLILARWHAAGSITLFYGLGEGLVGSLSVGDDKIDRLEVLYKVGADFFRPCTSLPSSTR